jgi:hypothetical protein
MSKPEQENGISHKEQTNVSQGVIWAAIVAVALMGVGLIGIFVYFILNPPTSPSAILTPTVEGTDTPGPTVNPSAIIAQAKLSTVKYPAVAEVYRENVPEGWIDGLLGRKERLLMLVYGDVEAGFDLEKLTEENLWTDGTRVRLVLPAPEILNSSIDFDQTHIVYYENNLILEQNNPNLQGEALEEAQKGIKQAALRDGILDKANNYGKLYFENFLRSLGFTEVEVVTNAQVLEE